MLILFYGGYNNFIMSAHAGKIENAKFLEGLGVFLLRATEEMIGC